MRFSLTLPTRRVGTGQRIRDTSGRTAEMVALIGELGPDIPEISKRLGQFKESVRYRYKEKVLGRGFGVQASVDQEKLGLVRVVSLVEFERPYEQYAHSILAAMNELCYVVYFEKRLLTGGYLVTASVPAEQVGAFEGFMAGLRAKGLFRTVETLPFRWFRVPPMKVDHYNFDDGRWDFDWGSIPDAQGDAGHVPSARVKYDRADLLILKELQVDATRSLVEIAQKLKKNYKALSWHYRVHVLGRGMVSNYYLRWMGTTYDSRIERALHRSHRYQHVAVLARGLRDEERMHLASKAHSVPFLWSESLGDGEYFADFFFPTENIVESFQFVTAAVAGLGERASVMLMDQSEALSFTLPYQLYDEELGKWVFDAPALLQKFEGLIRKIEDIGGA